jgi:hypothetical protein
MPFACPACEAAVGAAPDAWLSRCPACGARLRGRAAGEAGGQPAYEVQVVGRPELRRRVSVPWDEARRRRLSAWLAWSAALTLGLIVVLYAVARFWP